MQFWKKRIVLLLAVALLGSEILSGVVVVQAQGTVNAAVTEEKAAAEETKEKERLPIPKDAILFGEEASAKEELSVEKQTADEIPVLKADADIQKEMPQKEEDANAVVQEERIAPETSLQEAEPEVAVETNASYEQKIDVSTISANEVVLDEEYSVSENGINGNDYGSSSYLKVRVDEDGYYTLLSDGDIWYSAVAAVYNEEGKALGGGSFSNREPLSLQLTAGNTYLFHIMINDLMTEGDLPVRITKAHELTMGSNHVAYAEDVSDVAVVAVDVTQPGMACASAYCPQSQAFRYSVRTNESVLYDSISSWTLGICYTPLIKATEGKAVLTIINQTEQPHSYEAGLYLLTPQIYDAEKKVQDVNPQMCGFSRSFSADQIRYQYYYASLAQFTPEESGEYFIATSKETEAIKVYNESQDIFGQPGLINYSEYNKNGFSVQLEAGENYNIEVRYQYGSPFETTDLLPLSICRQNIKEWKVGQKADEQIFSGLRVKFPVESGKFYRLSGTTTGGALASHVIKGYDCYGTVHFYENFFGSIFYATDAELIIDLVRENVDLQAVPVSILLEEFQPDKLELGKAVANPGEILGNKVYITSFTPSESSTYTFYALEYTEDGAHFGLFEEEQGLGDSKMFNQKLSVTNSYGGYLNEEFQIQYELEAGKTYYASLYTQAKKVESEDLVLGVEKSQAYTYTFSDVNTKAEWDIPLNLGATLNFDIPKTGFYTITANGDAESYRIINGTDGMGDINSVGGTRLREFTVYRGQAKSFFAPQNGNYTLQIIREFKKEGTDNVKVTIEKHGLEQIPLFSSETGDALDISLRESGDYAWSCFTAQQAGNYQLYAFYPNGRYDESLDDWIDCSYELYRMRGDILSYESVSPYDWISLDAGETIYVRTYTWNVYGEVSYQMLLQETYDLPLDTEKAIQTDSGQVKLSVSIPENGIYRLQMKKSDDTYYSIRDWMDAEDTDYQASRYLSSGNREIRISAHSPGPSSFTVKLTKETEVEAASEVSVEEAKKYIWVKYVAEKSEKKVFGVLNPNKGTGVTANVYELVNESYLEELDETYAYEEEENYCIIDFMEGETYYFRLNLSDHDHVKETYDKLTLYFKTVNEVSAKLGERASVKTDKVAILNLESGAYEVGWYQVALEGLSSAYRIGGKKINRSVDVKEDGTYYVYNRKKTSELYLQFTRESGFEEDEFSVTVKAYQPEPVEIKLNEEVSGTADGFVCYRFCAPEDGDYYLEAGGIKGYRYQKESQGYTTKLSSWYNDDYLTLSKGDKVTLYMENLTGRNYKLKIYRATRKVVFDYDEYTAFIASGGSVTLKSGDELDYDDWDGETSYYQHFKYDQYLVINNRGFKNPNRLWLLDYMDVEVQDERNNTYGYYEASYKERYPNKYCSEIFEGFMKPNGQRALSTEAVDPEYLLLAKMRPEFVGVQKISISGVNALLEGTGAKLTAVLDTMNKYQPTDPTVTWTSSDSSIVSVDANGTITAKKAGVAKITAKSNDRLGRSAAIDVTVSKKPDEVVYVEKVIIGGASQVFVDDEIQLTATLDTNGKGKPSRDGVTWSTSDPKIATVDENGIVKGICAGTAVITAKSNDGKASATYEVTVKNVVEKKISLNESKITMKLGTTYKWLTVTFAPKNTTIQTLTWKTSNRKVATVNSKGVITAKGIGKATITVTSRNGKTDKVDVTVTKDAIKMKKIVLPSKKSLYLGDSITLEPEITPVNTTNQKLKWSSSNEEVATVSSKGVVTAKKAGKTTITVVAQDGTKKSDKCVITVKELPKVTGLKVTAKKKMAEISWNKVKDADGYIVYMATAKNGTYRKVATVKAEETKVTQKKLSSNKRYYFKVAAFRKAGRKTYPGDESAVKNVKVK